MKNLEERQREMRERNAQNTAKSILPNSESIASHDDPEIARLKSRISDLEQQVTALQHENARLRAQKKIVVEHTREKSPDESLREQRHNFFKYSNARKYY